MLLAKEPELRDYLIRSFRRRFKPALQIGVLLLHCREPLVREQVGWTMRRLQCLETVLGGESSAAKSRELFAKVAHELLELVE